MEGRAAARDFVPPEVVANRRIRRGVAYELLDGGEVEAGVEEAGDERAAEVDDVVGEESHVARGSVVRRAFVRERERVWGRVGVVIGGNRQAYHSPGGPCAPGRPR